MYSTAHCSASSARCAPLATQSSKPTILHGSLRDTDTTIIGGFQSPMEKECLDLLLRGTASVVICPARGLNRMRTPKSWQNPLAEGRMLILSFFNWQHPSPDLSHSSPAQRVHRRTRRPHPYRPCGTGRQNRDAMQGRARSRQAGICPGLT